MLSVRRPFSMPSKGEINKLHLHILTKKNSEISKWQASLKLHRHNSAKIGKIFTCWMQGSSLPSVPDPWGCKVFHYLKSVVSAPACTAYTNDYEIWKKKNTPRESTKGISLSTVLLYEHQSQLRCGMILLWCYHALCEYFCFISYSDM